MISTTIITLNEQKNIKRALESVKDLAEEIIVVDSGSFDQTARIAKEYGAKVFYRKFDNFANQKNWAAQKVSNKWVLSLDADEEIPDELAKEIRQAIKKDNIAGFLISRKNIILGKEIKHSRWSPDMHIWLWQKDQGKWIGEVHEEVVVKGPVGQLKHKKIHYSHVSISDFFESNNFYSTLLAKSLFKKGVRFSFFRMLWDACFEFKIRYFYKLGFLDGWRGFVLAYLMGIYRLMVSIKLWELEKRK